MAGNGDDILNGLQALFELGIAIIKNTKRLLKSISNIKKRHRKTT